MTFMFLLKKILSPFLMPLPLAFVLLAAGLALRRNKRRRRFGNGLAVAGIGLMLAASYGFTGRPLLERLEYRYDSKPELKGLAGVKWVVVLGGGVWDDGRLSSTARLTESSVCRLAEGIRLWRQIPGSKLLLSGGRVYTSVPEAQAMAELAIELGVPDSCLALEMDSRDTGEQARLVAGMVGDQRMVLVTSAAHMPRSMALFRRQGIYPVPAPSNFMVKRGQSGDPSRFFPSSVGIEVWETVIHEAAGMAWSKITGRI